jgi:hypothetical protein
MAVAVVDGELVRGCSHVDAAVVAEMRSAMAGVGGVKP